MPATQTYYRANYPHAYTLTEMTGRNSAEDRTFVRQGFEFKRRHRQKPVHHLWKSHRSGQRVARPDPPIKKHKRRNPETGFVTAD